MSLNEGRLNRALGEIVRDVRYGLRMLRRTPMLSAVVVLTLGLAIAANTAVFSIVNALLLKAPAVQDAGGLIRVQLGESRMSWPNFLDIRANRPGIEDAAAQERIAVPFGAGSTRMRASGTRVTDNFFALLGTPAALGRTLLPGDPRADVIVLSERFWRRHLGADGAIVGRLVEVGARRVEVVGVMPSGFVGLAPPGLSTDFWIPFEPQAVAALTDRSSPSVEVVARLGRGVSRAQAVAAFGVLAGRIGTDHPALADRTRQVRLSGITGFDAFQGIGGTAVPLFGFIGLLLVLAALILLVSCANIAGLLIGRSEARRREITIRLALGSGRGRLIRQLLVENLLLAAVAGAAGILLSTWIIAGLQAATTHLPIPVDLDLTLDWHVLSYAAAVAGIAALLFGLAPARLAARTDLVRSLKDDRPAGGQRFRRVLVTGQIVACTVLLLWASLFARSLGNVSKVDPGFTTENVFVIALDTQTVARSAAAANDGYTRLAERVGALPAVASIGLAWAVPLAFESNEEHGVLLLNAPAPAERRVMTNTVSPGFFDTISIPLRAGRDLSWTDRATAAPVVVVNETAARQFWQGDAIGQRMRLWDRAAAVDAEVVGVVADSKYWTLGEDVTPTIYRPMLQRSMSMNLFVRTSDAARTLPALRVELEQSGVLPAEIRRFSDATAASMMPARVASLATAAFGSVGLLLAVVGIYGLVAFSVAQRTRELGIRLALGASRAHILRSVVVASLGGVLAGVTPGVLLGALGGRLLAAFLVEVSSFDPLAAVGVLSLVLTTAAAASVGPAVRASRVDPLEVLRES